jgi:hypothetical protein
MADTKDINQRHDAALERIAKALDMEVADLIGDAPGDPPLARALMMENIANVIDPQPIEDRVEPPPKEEPEGTPEGAADNATLASVASDTGQEQPPVTVETVEIKPSDTEATA